MLTPNDLTQALRPAFVVYALAMVSVGAAHRFAPAGPGPAADRLPAAARVLVEAFAPATQAREGRARVQAWAGLRVYETGGIATGLVTRPCCPAVTDGLIATLSLGASGDVGQPKKR